MRPMRPRRARRPRGTHKVWTAGISWRNRRARCGEGGLHAVEDAAIVADHVEKRVAARAVRGDLIGGARDAGTLAVTRTGGGGGIDNAHDLRAIEPPGLAEAEREIGGADEQRVHPGKRRDR